MSFTDEYYAIVEEQKKKKKEQKTGDAFTDAYNAIVADHAYDPVATLPDKGSSFASIDIAPLGDMVSMFGPKITPTTKDDDEDRKWFDTGAFDDGYQFGDVFKTILGTATDVAENIGAGILGMGEKALDAIAYVSPLLAKGQFYQNGGEYMSAQTQKMFNESNDAAKKWSADFIKKDLYDEEEVAKKIVLGTDKNSVLGEKSDALIQSGGQLLGTMGLQAVGVPWWVSYGVTTFGEESANAMNQGATYSEAGASAAISAAAEVLTEKLSGGITFGGKAVSDVVTSKIARGISNKYVRTLMALGVDAIGEGAEEWITADIQKFGQWLTYRDEEELKDLLFSEEAMDEKIEAFIGGAVLGGGVSTVNAVSSARKGIDYASKLTTDEKSVVDKVYQDRIAEAKKNGKITEKEKSKIYDQVRNDLENGYISIETIEEVLGDKDYQTYKETFDSEEAIRREYEELGKKQNATLAEQSRYTELEWKMRYLDKYSTTDALKNRLSEAVQQKAQGSRLVESYNERSRRGQAFEADISKYDEKQRTTIQKAIDSGILNNTNRTHEFVDMIAKITADKGVLFDFTNNEKLKESGFAVDGKEVNGFLKGDTITLNMDSAKARNSVVGHEITHVLEGTELYQTLQDTVIEYAKAKGDYQGRYDALAKLYEGVEGADINAELTADLVGDYLFTDTDFVRNLSVQHRNVFQKIYDEIKYLCKVATAGSKEARELEKVKKAFEDAYRADGKAQSNTKYSLTDSEGVELSSEQQEYFKDSKVRDEDGNLKVMYHGSRDAGFHVFDGDMSDDGISFFFVDRNDVAASYSSTTETYEAKTIRSAKDMNNFLAEIGQDEDYSVVEKDGKYELLYDGERVAGSDTAQGIYEEFCWYEGVGEGDANYKVYLNLTNPLVVDAEGRNWDNVSQEFWPELYEHFRNEFTEEEKAALIDLAGWEDYSTFKTEINRAVRDAGKPTADENTKLLNSAYWKNADMSSLFSMAANNFSDEVLKEEAVKQMNTRDYAQRAKEQGYDGVIFKNIVDVGQYAADFTPSTVAVAFDSNQIKSTANVKPTTDADIRYSLSDAQPEYTTESEVQFSLSNDTAYMDKAIAANNNSMTVDNEIMEETKRLRAKIAGRMNEIKDRGLVALPDDVEGNTYIANSSYDGTEENTTICPRSLASEAFVDAVSEYLGRPLTVEEQIYISQDLQGRTLTPECLYCYVATDRKAYRAFLGEWVKQRDTVLEKLKADPNADVSRSGKLYNEFRNGRKDTNPMYDRFKMWVNAYKNGAPMIDGSHLANINKLMGDINSEFGAELKPQIVDAMKYAQSASWAKKRVNYVAYNGHILNWKQNRINKLNSHYGLRMYSFSDFHPAFVLENMQMITDASVRGLKMLGYTKDTDFVEIFAPSGMNINVSTFGFESGGQVFENNIIGANWDTAKQLREQYPNVGITFVATNDTIVDWALKQEWIDVVIPYHLVRTGAEVAKALNYTNYTSESSDTKAAEWKKGDKKYIAPTEHNNDKATYLAALEKNHLKPRFERFLSNPNYMKLVNECRQPASESKPVKPIFNEDAAMKSLAKLEANGYYQPIGGSVDRMYEIAAEVAENMTHELAPAMSLSNVGEEADADSLSALKLEAAPVQEETVSETETVAENATVEENLFPDDAYAPVAKPKQSVAMNAPVAAKYEAITYDAQPGKGVAEGQQSFVKEEPQQTDEERKQTRKQLHQSIIDNVKNTFKAKGLNFDKVLKNAKNLSTLSTVDNTPQRVMEKALGYKEGQILSDLTVNKVAQNETEGIKWLNKQVDTIKKISKQYGIKPGSKQSAAAQMYAEGFYVAENNDIIAYGDAELAKDFPDARVQQSIKRLANDPRIRRIYDDTLAAINESRTRNAYPEIPRLDNYFLHFRAMEDTFSKLGLPFNPNDIRAKDLPTDLNGVTADLKPGQPYFASANHRRGKRTSFDMLGGLERYLNSAKNQIYHIDDIQTLRALRNYIAETYGQAVGLENLDTLTNEEAQERIEQIYGSHLSTFAKFLNEEANVIAGKTALIDRGLEGMIGRRGMTFMNTLNGQVGSNMVGFNISSSLTNFLPVAQTFAKTNKFDFTKAFAQTVANKLSGGRLDSFAKDSPVMIRRKGADSFYRTPWQKAGDVGYVFMSAVDDISTEMIARTKYNEFVRKGMDPQKAHFETDKWVSRLMGDRSLGQMPQLYNSKMLGLITKFQLEVRNQLDSQFYDTIQEAQASSEHIQNGLLRNAKTAAKITSTMVQLAVVQHMYGKAFEQIAGYNPAFDIIEVLMTAFGYDDEEDSEDTVLDNLAQAILALAEDLPYTSVALDGGRVPMSSAIPDVASALRGEDEYGNEIGVVPALVEEVKEVAPYYLMPGGYGQIKKTKAGLDMYSDEHPIAGSYTDSGNLRFPVDDAPIDKVKAAIFGQYASENARKYFNGEERTLNQDQTKIFAELDMPIEDYWAYRDSLYEFYDYKDALSEAAKSKTATVEDILKSKYVGSVYSDINELYKKQKEYANGNSLLKSGKIKEIQKQMSRMLANSQREANNLSVSGMYAEVGGRRYNYDAEEAKWYEINEEKGNFYYEKEQEVTKGLGISYAEYWNNRDEYNFAYDHPQSYALAKTVGGYKTYMTYYDALENWQSDTYIASDKDENGDTIYNSRKKKVQAYLKELDIPEMDKLLLYKSVYNSYDDRNYEIIDYLNKSDLTFEETVNALRGLGFDVTDDGDISWK